MTMCRPTHVGVRRVQADAAGAAYVRSDTDEFLGRLTLTVRLGSIPDVRYRRVLLKAYVECGLRRTNGQNHNQRCRVCPRTVTG